MALFSSDFRGLPGMSPLKVEPKKAVFHQWRALFGLSKRRNNAETACKDKRKLAKRLKSSGFDAWFLFRQPPRVSAMFRRFGHNKSTCCNL
jgi:hypothetical protein